MVSENGKLGRAVRFAGIVLVLGAVLLLAGCGKDGKIYGSVDWSGTLTAVYIGGFPGTFYSNTYYEIAPGTYEVDWQSWDGSTYYPSISAYWMATYTVEADKGTIPMVNGDDHFFDLYLGYAGIYKGGDVKAAAVPGAGIRSWTVDGLRITVSDAVRISADEAAKRPMNHVGR